MYVHLLLPGGRGSSRRLRRQRWAAQRPRIASDAPRVSVLLPVPGRSPAAASHEATHISLKKILFFCGRRHHVFDVALSRGKLSGSGLVRECSISVTAYASDVPAFSRTSPLPQNPVSSVGYRLFDKSRLAGDAVDAVSQENRAIVHLWQAASHGLVFASRQRDVEDAVTRFARTNRCEQ